MPGIESADSSKAIPNVVEVAYSCPLRLETDDYATRLSAFEESIIRSQNLHTCEPRRCLVTDKKGGLICKRRAPFQRSEADFVSEDSTWGSKHLYEFLNAWVPALTVNIRCNNSVKLLTNCHDTMSVSFYITIYRPKSKRGTPTCWLFLPRATHTTHRKHRSCRHSRTSIG